MKLVSSPKELFAHIKSNDSLFVHAGAATPIYLLNELVKEAPRLKNVEILHMHTEGPAPYAHPEYAESFHVSNLFVGKNIRPFMNYESVDYIPCFLSELPLLFRNGFKKLNVALVNVSTPDKHGYVSLGVSVDCAKAAVETADIVLAQINSHMPRVHGDGLLHVDEIDFAFNYDEKLYSPKHAVLTETEMMIGKNIANLIEDGSTLQLGIGNIPNAVCNFLKGHKHLGLHTEMWSDGAFELIKCGAIDNSKKNFHQGKCISTFMIGSQELYAYANDNMTVENLDVSYVNYPIYIMRNPKVTAINSCVEIDLTGQVCADSIGTRHISGVGGQMDFMRAAALSQGGKPIMAFTSTTPKGESRIANILKPGAGVVTTRAHVHYVVTEHGVVNLFGKTLGERAKALISIAHPEHRERLEREWRVRIGKKA